MLSEEEQREQEREKRQKRRKQESSSKARQRTLRFLKPAVPSKVTAWTLEIYRYLDS